MKADFPRYHIEDLPSFLFENKINEKIKNNQHSTIDSANNECYITYRTKEEEQKEEFRIRS